MGIIVICSYRAKPEKEAALKDLLLRHVPALRRLKLATDRPVIHARSKDGTFLEIFEWASEEASRGAHDHPEVQRLWGEFADVCEFVPMSGLEELARPFAHFTPL